MKLDFVFRREKEMHDDTKNLEGLILFFGLILIARGLWFVIISGESFLASDTYRLMNGLIPQWGWAILCLAIGIILLLALTNMPLKYLWMVLGGLLSAAIYVLFTLATWDAVNISVFIILHPLTAIFSLSIAWMGGECWWRIRKSVPK